MEKLIRKPYGFKYEIGKKVVGGTIVDRVRRMGRSVVEHSYGVQDGEGEVTYIVQDDIREKNNQNEK